MSVRSRLDDLRRALEAADDFAPVLDRFLAEVAGDPEFLGRGFPVDEPRLDPILRGVVHRAVGPSARIELVALHRLTPIPFVHGAVLVDGRAGLVLWFEDRGVGLFAVPGRRVGEVEICRFRALVTPVDEVSPPGSAAGRGGRWSPP